MSVFLSKTIHRKQIMMEEERKLKKLFRLRMKNSNYQMHGFESSSLSLLVILSNSYTIGDNPN